MESVQNPYGMRMLKFLGLVLLLQVNTAFAGEDWTAMAVSDLTGLTLDYETATQVFYESGRTLYDAGQPSWGYWRDQAGRYCSQWPPSDLWACYDLERSGASVRFLDDRGDATVGVIR